METRAKIIVGLMLLLTMAARTAVGAEQGVGADGAAAGGKQAPEKPAAGAVEFDVYSGYFVSNKFEPDQPASFVALHDQKSFDEVFGAAFVMRDRSHRLPKDAFDTKFVIAAIKRGKAMWTFNVEKVSAKDGVLTVAYSAKSVPQPSAEYACPLIVSLPRGQWRSVRFVEDTREVRAIDLPGGGGARDAAGLDVRCEKQGDAVKVASADGGRTVLTVTSQRGIGGATITRTGDRWPEAVVLRLQLGGLEQMSIANGEVQLRASVQSHGDRAVLLHLWKGSEEGPQLTPKSPYWMTIDLRDADGKPVARGLPPRGGWFEMTVPRALLGEQEKTLTLGWIDFYRR